jgi:hypothetical protein
MFPETSVALGAKPEGQEQERLVANVWAGTAYGSMVHD